MQTRSMKNEPEVTEYALGINEPDAFEGQGQLKKNAQSGLCKTASLSSRISGKIFKALRISDIEEGQVKREAKLQWAISDAERTTELAMIEVETDEEMPDEDLQLLDSVERIPGYLKQCTLWEGDHCQSENVDMSRAKARSLADASLGLSKFMGGKPAKLRSEVIEELVRTTPFTEQEVHEWYHGFLKDCPTGQLTIDDFQHIYTTFFPYGDAKPFARYVFRAFDKNGDGIMEFREFLTTLSVISRGKLEEKLKWAFSVYDFDGDGFISRGEMTDVIKSIYLLLGSVVKMPEGEATPEQRTSRVFELMDKDRDDRISLEEFLEGVQTDPDVLQLLKLDTMALGVSATAGTHDHNGLNSATPPHLANGKGAATT